MNTLHLKTGDTAVVLSGKEKGKQGKVLSVNPKKGMVCLLYTSPSQRDTERARKPSWA